MEEIKVGEYVRTNSGTIGKIKSFLGGAIAPRVELEKVNVSTMMIKKHSSNLIDLIEVGDYVNGYKVLEITDSIYENSKRILIYKNEKEKYERWIYIQEYDGKIHTQDDIKSIVTHQQFESIKYEV